MLQTTSPKRISTKINVIINVLARARFSAEFSEHLAVGKVKPIKCFFVEIFKKKKKKQITGFVKRKLSYQRTMDLSMRFKSMID